MCEFVLRKNSNPRIDKCMIKEVDRVQRRLNEKYAATKHLSIVASCCGHGKYSRTIVVCNDSNIGKIHYEYYSKKDIPRKKKFYSRDRQGYYYIREVC